MSRLRSAEASNLTSRILFSFYLPCQASVRAQPTVITLLLLLYYNARRRAERGQPGLLSFDHEQLHGLRVAAS